MNKVIPIFPVTSNENKPLIMEETIAEKTSNEALHHHWSEKVEITDKHRLSRRRHLPSNDIRHNCTNYDDLCKSLDKLFLEDSEDIEKATNLAVIKYECTTKALQWRLTQVRQSEKEAAELNKGLKEDLLQKKGIISRLLAFITGNEEEIKLLKSQIEQLEISNNKFQEEVQVLRAKVDLDVELSRLEKELNKERKRRRELARNNQSLGGRVSHYEQVKGERDLYSDLLEKEELANAALLQELKIKEAELFNLKRDLNDHKVLKRTLAQEITILKNKLKNRR